MDNKNKKTYRPIVVKMGKSISQSLVDIRGDSSVIFNNIVAGGRNGTLRNFLRHQEEVESLIERHFIVDNRAARRIARSTLSHGEKSRVDPLAYDNECNGWIIHTSPEVICSSTSIGTSLLLKPKNDNCIEKRASIFPQTVTHHYYPQCRHFRIL